MVDVKQVRDEATRRVSIRHGHRPVDCPRPVRMEAQIEREMLEVAADTRGAVFTVTVTMAGRHVSTHKAESLDAVYVDILTDGLPSDLMLVDAVALLGSVTGEGGTIEVGARRITVTKENR